MRSLSAAYSRPHSRSNVLQLAIVTVNALIGLWLMTVGNSGLFASLLMFASFQIAGGLFAFVVADSKPRAVSFVLLVFYCYGFIMPGLYQLRTSDYFWASIATDVPTATVAAFIVFLSVIFFVVGYFTRLNVRFGGKWSDADKVSVDGPAARRSGISSIVTLAVALLALAYVLFLLARFGPLMFFGTRSAISDAISGAGLDSSGRGLTRTLAQSLGLSSLAITGYVKFRTRSRGFLINAAFYIALVANGVANFPTSIARYWLVATAFVFLFTVFYGSFLRMRRSIYVATPLLLFLIFPTLGSYNRRGTDLNMELKIVPPSEYMTSGDLDGFQSILNVVNMVETQGISWGAHMLSVLLFFVPRSIWSGKTFSVGSEAADAAGYHFLTISMPFPGELYANGGFVAVVLGMLAFGMLIRQMDSTFDRASTGERAPYVAVTAILMGAFMPILFRGSLLGSFAGFASAVGLVWGWWYLGKVRLRLR